MARAATKYKIRPPRSVPGAAAPAPPVSDYLARNTAAWERWAAQYVAAGRAAWQEAELRWGIWGLTESELQLLSELRAGADVVELGCGTAAISAWLARNAAAPWQSTWRARSSRPSVASSRSSISRSR